MVKPFKSGKSVLEKKVSMFVTVGVAVAAVILRTTQLMNNMDFATGKYIEKGFSNNFTAIVLIIGLGLIFAVMTLGTAKDKVVDACVLVNPYKLRYDKLAKKISNKAAYVMFFTAFTIVLDIYFQLSALATYNKQFWVDPKDLPPGFYWPNFPFAGLSAMEWVVYFFMLVMIVTLASSGTNIIKGEGLTKGNCFFFIFYPVLKLLDALVLMGKNEVIGAYSESVYILLTSITAASFVLLMMRFFSGFGKKSTRFWMIIFGYYTMVLAAVSIIPRFVMFFFLDYTQRDSMTIPDITDLGIGLIAMTIIAVFWSKFEFKPAPKSPIKATRSWVAATAVEEMESLDYDNVKADVTQGKLE